MADYGTGMLTVDQVAKRLGISHTSARRLVDLGKMPSTVHPHKRCLLVREGDLDAYIEHSKMKPGDLGATCNQYRGHQFKRAEAGTGVVLRPEAPCATSTCRAVGSARGSRAHPASLGRS